MLSYPASSDRVETWGDDLREEAFWRVNTKPQVLFVSEKLTHHIFLEYDDETLKDVAKTMFIKSTIFLKHK